MRDQRPPASRGSPHRTGRSCGRDRGIALGALTLALVLTVTCGGPRSRQDVDADTRAINDRLIAGDYREAERLAADARDCVSRSDGAESLELARLEDLLVTALVKGGRGGMAQALALAEHARQVKEAALGSIISRPRLPCILSGWFDCLEASLTRPSHCTRARSKSGAGRARTRDVWPTASNW